MNKIYSNSKTTYCWMCDGQYLITEAECPHCGSANANVDQTLAEDQMHEVGHDGGRQ